MRAFYRRDRRTTSVYRRHNPTMQASEQVIPDPTIELKNGEPDRSITSDYVSPEEITHIQMMFPT